MSAKWCSSDWRVQRTVRIRKGRRHPEMPEKNSGVSGILWVLLKGIPSVASRSQESEKHRLENTVGLCWSFKKDRHLRDLQSQHLSGEKRRPSIQARALNNSNICIRTQNVSDIRSKALLLLAMSFWHTFIPNAHSLILGYWLQQKWGDKWILPPWPAKERAKGCDVGNAPQPPNPPIAQK